jgi:hypothetical protein
MLQNDAEREAWTYNVQERDRIRILLTDPWTSSYEPINVEPRVGITCTFEGPKLSDGEVDCAYFVQLGANDRTVTLC